MSNKIEAVESLEGSLASQRGNKEEVKGQMSGPVSCPSTNSGRREAVTSRATEWARYKTMILQAQTRARYVLTRSGPGIRP
jgi:hypothetical protein